MCCFLAYFKSCCLFVTFSVRRTFFNGIATDIADVDGFIEKTTGFNMGRDSWLSWDFCRILVGSLPLGTTHPHAYAPCSSICCKKKMALVFGIPFLLGSDFFCPMMFQINMHVKAFCCRLSGTNIILFLYSRIYSTAFSDFFLNKPAFGWF